ncbi:phosphatidylglycerol lysyltransferase domain-containing protein [Niabella beijingensis]|uniref:phosphatidylglycerol lysyltransferase domain-containing protein n=1 Tax=Niabella beijingensis TaxID=2872700 RepID=UPI001CBDE4CA|nr:phosphatidylglycerol lysyltransferase domain-containing protein [Niabella beijingensis]MBZ4191453.1 phosphatidylglycerol lysyltransferase domain-containing protein [Niabella beijingensis]
MKERLLKQIRRFSPKTYWKEILAVLVILLAFVFFRSERKELQSIMPQLRAADGSWIIAGLAVSALYVLLQALMYIYSFRAMGMQLKLSDAVELFLKRNFLSVFLPAGGISSLAYTTSQLRKRNLNATQIHQASAIYGYVGLLTVFLIGVPVILYTIGKQRHAGAAGLSLLLLGLLLGAVFFIVYSFREKRKLYLWISRKFPSVINNIDEIFSGTVNRQQLWRTIAASLAIECCGIAHVYISIYALGATPSFQVAAVGYTLSVVLMILSPFLRGLGAVEFTMLYIFMGYGYRHDEGLGITLLYRVFEFWIPLLLGLFAFIWRGRQLVARIVPAVAIFFLGIVNIISVATPPLAERMRLDRYYLPVEAIHASKLMVLVLGVSLLVTSAYLIKGLRAAWVAALIFTALSILGNIAKALDYEESLLAGFILVLLITNSRQYRIRENPKWIRIGFTTFFITLISVCLFDFLSFYFIDKRHFGIDFNWRQSLYYTLRSFLLFSDDELTPKTLFGRDFVNITRFLGTCSWLLLIYSLLRPRIFVDAAPDPKTAAELAKEILEEHGRSAVDYFKTMADKQLFFSGVTNGFTAYRVANDFAVVLEEPVCAAEDKIEVLAEFERFCRQEGLKTVYYRVDESSLLYFENLRKMKIFLGQEAIMEVGRFTLEGKDRKSMRNGLNSLQKKGYKTVLVRAPQTDAFLEELRSVSDEWLDKFEKKELVFSQGMFNRDEIRSSDVIVVKDADGTVQAFLNIIRDYTPEECTYDLIRKRLEAPGGCMDALIVKLTEYAREKEYKYLNLGMIPLNGMEAPDNPAERIIKYASQRMGSFRHYKTLRDFKEKYATIWENKYMIFGNDFDLLQIPGALRKVMKPLSDTN